MTRLQRHMLVIVGHCGGSPDQFCSPEIETEPRDSASLTLHHITAARPLDDWHDDIGPVLWWKFPVDEPPYVGSPLDDDWPGYHTHWTPLPPCPAAPNDPPSDPDDDADGPPAA